MTKRAGHLRQKARMRSFWRGQSSRLNRSMSTQVPVVRSMAVRTLKSVCLAMSQPTAMSPFGSGPWSSSQPSTLWKTPAESSTNAASYSWLNTSAGRVWLASSYSASGR
jgi:hypothetical protein